MRYGLVCVLLAALGCGGSSSDDSGAGNGGQGPGPAPNPQPGVPAPLPATASAFVNWENLSVHPVELTQDGQTLLVCNTPDNRLELFDVAGGAPAPAGSVAVGLDPVSVRARTDTEVWVVNHISDSVSVVDLATGHVRATLQTLDEPADVVFAAGRAYVSCSQANAVQVFDPGNLAAAPVTIPIDAEDPRAMAVSADGSEVYVAIFESGNSTTVLGGGIDEGGIGGVLPVIAFPPNVVNDPDGPHGGVNPPPNAGAVFNPPLRAGNPTPPAVSLVVRKDGDGKWLDDTGADWTEFVSGNKSDRSGRPQGWDLIDRDVAIVDTATNAVRYVSQCMNICAAITVRPTSGEVFLVGTDATNDVRYEPVIAGRFIRVLASRFDPTVSAASQMTDLNPHLDYTTPTIAQGQRDQSVGDPRGIAWTADGARAFVTGMGSNNVAVFDPQLQRIGRIEVGEGPTGIVIGGNRAYVLNRFDGSVSAIDTTTLAEVSRVALFDPTPAAIKSGRVHLYGTHETSGLGHIACASCHVDARMDRLAWDLGDPSGEVKALDEQNCLTNVVQGCEDFHPMKGPMLTQTLQDIIGKEPHHWRGDRDGLEEFNPAFLGLLGDDQGLTAQQMQAFEDLLASIHFPPNPLRNFDNSLPTDVDLTGHFTPGRFAPAGQPLPNGDAVRGLSLYRTASLDGGVPGFQCVTCHTLPTGIGPDFTINGFSIGPAPVGPNGEKHHSLVSVDGGTNVSMKIPQLRNLYERVGFETTQTLSRAGFGFIHDGSVDSLARFVSEPVFTVDDDQEIADLVAFMLAFSGSDLPTGSSSDILELPGPESKDSHAAVGTQTTFGAARDETLLTQMVALAGIRAVGLVARVGERGWWYDPSQGRFLSDRNGVTNSVDDLRGLAGPGNEVTFTLVPPGTGLRIGIDRDTDGFGDGTEREFGTDPADASDFPR